MKTIRTLMSRNEQFQVVVARANCAYVVFTYKLADDTRTVLKSFPYPPNASMLPQLAQAVAFAHASK